MIDRIAKANLSTAFQNFNQWLRNEWIPMLKRRPIFGLAFVASLLAVVYWAVIASDRYVSEAHVVVERTDSVAAAAAGVDLTSVFSGVSGELQDQLMLRDHLLSVDMLQKLDEKYHLRAHYSSLWEDPLSRMWFEDAPIEWFHEHYLARVSIELDEYTGILVIQAQAYDVVMAQNIANMLVQEGERYMNELAHRLARDQVVFLEKQVVEMGQRVINTRSALLEYQNAQGLASPTAQVEALVGITNSIEGQLSQLKAKRSAMLSYLSQEAPDIIQANAEIAALETQLSMERARLATPKGQTLNKVVEEYQRLELEAKFAQDVYQTALVALEKGRLEALRNLKKLSVLQSPTKPQYPVEPRRFYNIIIFILCAAMLAGIFYLVTAIIKDHKD